MRLFSSLRSIQGFTAVETLAAIAIATMVGYGGSRLLLNTTMTVNEIRHMKKASALAGMVIEQYNAYVNDNYQTLDSHDVSRVLPKDFFNTADNMGYDGMYITTETAYSNGRTTCVVDVTVYWPAGHAGEKHKRLSKTYSATTTPTSSGIAQIWVQLTDGTGVSGITVSAPSVSGGVPSQGVTNGSGLVVLDRLALGNLTFTASAPIPSHYSVAPGSSAYRAGHYVYNAGAYDLSVQVQATVSRSNVTTIVISSFQAAGQITGHLDNLSNVSENVDMRVSLVEAAVADAGQYQFVSGVDKVTVLTDSSGNYGFYNVIPTALSVVAAEGKRGSSDDPLLHVGDAGFEQGYADPAPYNFSAANFIGLPTPPAWVIPFQLKALGTILLHTVKASDGTAIGNASITATLPSTYDHPVRALVATSGPGGTLLLSNVISFNTSVASFTADNGSYSGTASWACSSTCIGIQNSITIFMSSGYTLVGQFALAAGNPSSETTAGLTMWMNNTAGRIENVHTDAAGNFQFANYTPTTFFSTWAGPPQTIKNTWLYASQMNPIYVTVSGQVRDSQTAMPAPNAAVAFYYSLDASNNVTVTTLMTDSSGNLPSSLLKLQWTSFISFGDSSNSHSVSCEAATRICTPSQNPWPLDMTKAYTTYEPPRVSPHGWMIVTTDDSNQPSFKFTEGDFKTISPKAYLQDYQVEGMVTDAGTGAPLGGIQITDHMTGYPFATTSNGSDGKPVGYYKGWCKVNYRGGSYGGDCRLKVNAGQTSGGSTYNAIGMTTVLVPLAADPTVPVTQNLACSSSGGGG